MTASQLQPNRSRKVNVKTYKIIDKFDLNEYTGNLYECHIISSWSEYEQHENCRCEGQPHAYMC